MPGRPGAPRLRAPELRGRGGWLNTGGVPLRLADLRGRAVLLDFWTGCCVNCLHVLAELRPVETRFGDDLVVVGVHSPKFAFEREHATVVAAVERYGVDHPVLDDPDMTTWQAYTARAWPTLVLLDTTGRIAGQWSGEGHAHAVATAVAGVLGERDAAGVVPPPRTWATDGGSAPAPRGLRFPSRVVQVTRGPGAGDLLVADTGHHSVVRTDPSGADVRRRFGSGARGLVDGLPERATFAEPAGLLELPADIADRVGYDVLVADTANHALRGLALADGSVSTVAGTGRPWLPSTGDTPVAGRPATDVDLSSPWDLAWWRGRVWIAMAGIHQLWTFDPTSESLEVVAGTRQEGLVDGPLAEAWFAQTSALAADPARDRLWLVDPETSALRVVRDGPSGLEVATAAGRGLFDFGHRDGPGDRALLQHPLGVRVADDGAVLVADTYNGALRRFDPAAQCFTTIADDLAEPGDVLVDGGRLLVLESAGSRLRPVDADPHEVDGTAERVERPPTVLRPGTVELAVTFTPPVGQQLDDSAGLPTRLVVAATPPSLLRAGAGADNALRRTLELDPAVGDGVLHVSARAASCDLPDAADPNPACRLHQQDWGVPVVLDPDGSAVLTLVLGDAAS